MRVRGNLGNYIDDAILQNAARTLHSHFGSLLDLPEELRNTLASAYYEAL